MKRGALLLLPNLLGEMPHPEVYLPKSVFTALLGIDGLIAESETGGRRYLGRFKLKRPAREIPIALLNKNTKEDELDFLLEPLMSGQRWGVVSDAGLPCIADPGARLVFRAKQKGIPVQVFIGPSSIVMALMLSGLTGQSFAFYGYLPKECNAKIKELEARSKNERQTQIVMETPYRNAKFLQILLDTLAPKTMLSIAWELTLPGQGSVTQTVERWKSSPLPNLAKKNAVFLFLA